MIERPIINRYYPPAQARPAPLEKLRRKRVTKRVHQDVFYVLEELYDLGLSKQLLALARPNLSWSIVRLLRVFAICALVWTMLFFSLHFGSGFWWLLPLMLLLLGIQQLALAKHLHDTAHGNLALNRPSTFMKKLCGAFGVQPKLLWNDLIRDWVITPLLFQQSQQYMQEHQSHHAYLGFEAYDEEKLPPKGEGLGFMSVWCSYLCSASRFWSHVLGHLSTYRHVDWYRLLLFWSVFLLLAWSIGGRAFALDGFIIWQGARVFVYYPLRMVTELCDHHGLRPGEMIAYTRSMPGGWFGACFYPDNDRYHVAHHLFPKIPLAHLKQAHHILLKCPLYARGRHFNQVSDLMKSF